MTSEVETAREILADALHRFVRQRDARMTAGGVRNAIDYLIRTIVASEQRLAMICPPTEPGGVASIIGAMQDMPAGDDGTGGTRPTVPGAAPSGAVCKGSPSPAGTSPVEAAAPERGLLLRMYQVARACSRGLDAEYQAATRLCLNASYLGVPDFERALAALCEREYQRGYRDAMAVRYAQERNP